MLARNRVRDRWASVWHGIRGRFGMAVDMVEQLMLLRLNKQIIPEIVTFRDSEAEIRARIPRRKNAVTDKVDEVNAREAAAIANAPGGVSAPESFTAPTGTAAN